MEKVRVVDNNSSQTKSCFKSKNNIIRINLNNN